MTRDRHVHVVYSGATTIDPLSLIMQESYDSPVTGHECVDGLLTIADRPNVVIGCEVAVVFPEDGVDVHPGVVGIDESQHREIQWLRHDGREQLDPAEPAGS